jgi:uncharacterized membrane protein (DUF106 family)
MTEVEMAYTTYFEKNSQQAFVIYFFLLIFYYLLCWLKSGNIIGGIIWQINIVENLMRIL